jgi:hypothetical protein
VDHLTQQKDSLVRIFFQSLVTNFNGILYSITKTKMPGDKKSDGAKIQNGRRKILLA